MSLADKISNLEREVKYLLDLAERSGSLDQEIKDKSDIYKKVEVGIVDR